MSILQNTSRETASGHLFCPQCNAVLPHRATFCSSCGERLGRERRSTLLSEEDINNRYRITTLVRRRPHINLYFALDNRWPLPVSQPRMVAIRDIEITGLEEETKAEAIALVQHEYNQLRNWHIPHLLASIDLHIFEGHFFLVLGMPQASHGTGSNVTRNVQRLYTLQDFLQSGQGLPKEARTLEWVRSLCQVVEKLHSQQVVLGDLDPYTVVLNKNSLTAEPKLMVSWLLPELRKLLPPPKSSNPQVSYFSAPEALQGCAEVRSDIYSLGALLYLLLTGTPPDESTLRQRRRLRTPQEINSRISPHVGECVMQALALEPRERFASVAELMAALEDVHFRQAPSKKVALSAQMSSVLSDETETVRVVPLSQKDVVRWRTARDEKQNSTENVAGQGTQSLPTLDMLAPTSDPLPLTTPSPTRSEMQGEQSGEMLPITPIPEKVTPPPPLLLQESTVADEHDTPPPESFMLKPVWKDRITGLLPVMPSKPHWKKAMPKKIGQSSGKKSVEPPKSESETSLLKQLQRLILGHQQHMIEAAAIIETPLRVRPDQTYNVRMHIMGRDEPTFYLGLKKNEAPAGLSALVHGETIRIEVRSVLQQGYTYVLQQTPVTIPANGYAAEVVIPMQPQPGGATGRRDRLHVFFVDEHRNPLYEKPFILEVFVSPLVHFGREGHQVLTIPI
jgi:serine/threonine protein kinase